MNKKAEELYEHLCKTFRCRPELTWHERHENNAYDANNHRLELSTFSWQGWKMPLVHEFAHALDTIRYAERLRHHDKQFYDILIRVVDVAYKSRKYYLWDREYTLLRRWAEKDGYISPNKEHQAC